MAALDTQQVQPIELVGGAKAIALLLTFTGTAQILIDLQMLQEQRNIGVLRSMFFSSKSVAGSELIIASVVPTLAEFRFLPKKQGFVPLQYVNPPKFTAQSTVAGGGTATLIFHERQHESLIWDTL